VADGVLDVSERDAVGEVVGDELVPQRVGLDAGGLRDSGAAGEDAEVLPHFGLGPATAGLGGEERAVGAVAEVGEERVEGERRDGRGPRTWSRASRDGLVEAEGAFERGLGGGDASEVSLGAQDADAVVHAHAAGAGVSYEGGDLGGEVVARRPRQASSCWV
jgi:hypothetical protein